MPFALPLSETAAIEPAAIEPAATGPWSVTVRSRGTCLLVALTPTPEPAPAPGHAPTIPVVRRVGYPSTALGLRLCVARARRQCARLNRRSERVAALARG